MTVGHVGAGTRAIRSYDGWMKTTTRTLLAVLTALGLAMVTACSAPTSASDAAVVEPVDTSESVDPESEREPGESETPGAITLAFGGDVHFERGLADLLDDPETALDPIAEQLSRADLAMVNLETSITTRGTPEPKAYTFRTTPEAFPVLAEAGVDVVTMANNHAVDFGAEGFEDTLAAKAAAPFPVVGIGADSTEAFAPAEFEIKGTKIAILAGTEILERTATEWASGQDKPGVAAALDPTLLVKAVRRASKQSDVVVVNLHWGYERQTCPSGRQTTLADQLIAAGADVLVGSHAHVLQGSGWKDGAFVAYGLGNFVWYNRRQKTTGVLTVTIEDGKPVKQTFDPAFITASGVPDPMVGAEKTSHQEAFDDLRGCTDLSGSPASDGSGA